MDMKLWRNAITVLLGLWILFSPVVLGFATTHRDVMWNSWLIGVIVLIVSSGRKVAEVPMVWQEAIDLVLGIWLIVSPWLLGFSTHGPATAATVAAGVLLAGLAVWTIATDSDLRRWVQDHKFGHRPHLMR